MRSTLWRDRYGIQSRKMRPSELSVPSEGRKQVLQHLLRGRGEDFGYRLLVRPLGVWRQAGGTQIAAYSSRTGEFPVKLQASCYGRVTC